MRALLDTHVVVWWFEGSRRLSEAQRRVLDAVSPKNPLWVSDFTLWEIATLVRLGRLHLDLPLREWLERATAPPLVQRVGVSPAIAAELSALPDDFHRDPADRTIVATGRVLGATLLTQDRRIIEADVVPTLA